VSVYTVLLLLCAGLCSSLARADQPSAPVLQQPADGATGVVRPLALVWQAVPDAAYYQVQFSTSKGFTTAVMMSPNIADTHFDAPLNLPLDTTYYWRVRTAQVLNVAEKSFLMSNWSPTATFTMAKADLPTPEPLSPKNGELDIIRKVQFAWAPVKGASCYTLQISRVPDIGNQMWGKDRIAVNECEFLDVLDAGVFYWRVMAVKMLDAQNGLGSLWSPWTKFTMGRLISQLPTPTVTAPTQNAVNVAVPVRLAWGVVTSAAGYVVQISPVDNFTTDVVLLTDLTATSVTAPALAPGGVYFWRVMAVKPPDDPNVPCVSHWTLTRKFTVADPNATRKPVVTPAENIPKVK